MPAEALIRAQAAVRIRPRRSRYDTWAVLTPARGPVYLGRGREKSLRVPDRAAAEALRDDRVARLALRHLRVPGAWLAEYTARQTIFPEQLPRPINERVAFLFARYRLERMLLD